MECSVLNINELVPVIFAQFTQVQMNELHEQVKSQL